MSQSVKKMPDNTEPRIRFLVEKSAPSTSRPRLSEEREKRLNATERKSAACYASMENSSAELSKLAEALEQAAKKVRK